MDISLSPRALRITSTLGVLAICAYVWLVTQTMVSGSESAWRAMVFIPVILLLNVPLLVLASRHHPERWFGRLLVGAFVLKCLASVARYYQAYVLYNGNDSKTYSEEGARLAAEYLQGNFGADIGRDFIGTGFMRVATGVVYMGTGPSILVAWTVFALLSFWGTYFLYRAFRIGVPGGDLRRYAVLLLLLPSMLFWPASLGKESWVVFGIGLMAYGSALVLAGYRTWALPLLLGVLVTGVVRPHITAMLFGALAIAWFLRRRPNPANELTPLAYVGGLAVIAVGGAAVGQFAARFLDVDLSVSGIQDAIFQTTDLTNEGGSTFTPATVETPLDLPWAAFTILFRPLPIEATNPAMMLAALEGMLLLVLVALSWRSLGKLPQRMRRQPYLIFALVYTVVFVYAFSNFGNFGILTRQRVQVLPFLLVFLALRPPRTAKEHLIESDREQERALT